MTSQLQSFVKPSNMIYFIDIFLSCKIEGIWIIQVEVFYTRLDFQDTGKFKNLSPTDSPPRNRVELFSIVIFLCIRYITNPRIFSRVFLILFRFLVRFFADFFILFVINFWFQISPFRVLNKAVSGAFLDTLKYLVLVAPQKCPLAEALPVCQNEIG